VDVAQQERAASEDAEVDVRRAFDDPDRELASATPLRARLARSDAPFACGRGSLTRANAGGIDAAAQQRLQEDVVAERGLDAELGTEGGRLQGDAEGAGVEGRAQQDLCAQQNVDRSLPGRQLQTEQRARTLPQAFIAPPASAVLSAQRPAEVARFVARPGRVSGGRRD